jgi:hypothetical protein
MPPASLKAAIADSNFDFFFMAQNSGFIHLYP